MKIALFIILSLLTEQAFSQQETFRREHFNLKHALAIEGYDPVSYFKENRPRPGKRDLSITFKGVTYYFATSENRDLFKNDPGKYEPQYGGWCAFAMGATGEKVEVDPGTFKIMDEKLYLFYNKFFTNTLNSWNKNAVKLRTQADNHWSKVQQ